MSLLTIAESSGFRATSTHAELMAYTRELEALGRRELVVSRFGRTPQGRELPLLVLSSEGFATPEAARAAGKPVVLVQCCIHAGEVEGKEAALMLARDLLRGPEAGLLEQLTLLVVPIFNADGNDAMDPAHRALQIERLKGQNGPHTSGTRVNSAGINLNRDHIRQETQEMRLLQQHVYQRWAPDLSIDTHATNGSVHRFAMTYDIPHTLESGRREPIDYMRQVFLPEVSAAVKKNAGFDSGWYGNFVEDERVLDRDGVADPASAVGEGWMTYPHHPRFGSNYRGLASRPDVLLECYSYLGFEERVRTTYAWLLELLRAAAGRGAEISGLVLGCRTPPPRVAVRYRLGTTPEPIEILTREPRTLGGRPVSVKMPYLGRFIGETVVERPRAYIVPGRLGAFFRGHGLGVDAAPASARVERATLESLGHVSGRAILEASGVGDRQVSWAAAVARLPSDSLLIATDQPLGALAVYLCEPESDDGLVEAGLSPAPPVGEAFEVLRLLD
jgi:Zinc carboxypeptidase